MAASVKSEVLLAVFMAFLFVVFVTGGRIVLVPFRRKVFTFTLALVVLPLNIAVFGFDILGGLSGSIILFCPRLGSEFADVSLLKNCLLDFGMGSFDGELRFGG